MTFLLYCSGFELGMVCLRNSYTGREWFKRDKIFREWQFSLWNYLVDARRKINSNDQLLQPRYAEEHFWTQIGYSCRTPRKISKILSKQSWFVLQHSDSTVWIWCKWHESIDILPRIYSSSCWRCNFEGLIFLAHLPFKHTAYLSIVADHVHPFIVHHLLWQLPAG